jgi:hypothetical protein
MKKFNDIKLENEKNKPVETKAEWALVDWLTVFIAKRENDLLASYFC